MRKYVITIISTILLFAMSCSPVFASDDNFVPGISGKPAVLISSASGKPGDDVEVDVSIVNNPGICAMYISINYAEGLELIEAADCGLLKSPVFSGDKKISPFILSWDDSANKDSFDNGKIATLKFKIPEEPKAEKYGIWISYKPDEIFNIDLEKQYFEAGFAEITVEGFDEVDGSISDEVSNQNSEKNDTNNTSTIVLICCIALLIIIGATIIVILKKKKR